MTDGSTAITMTGSHALGDGIAAAMRAFEAINGTRTDLGYPPAHSRTRFEATTEDLKQAWRDLPAAGRALSAAAKTLYERRHELRRKTERAVSTMTPEELKQNVMLPAVFVTLDIPEWDAAAQRLGGNGHSLLAGFAAKISAHLGRTSPVDGKVTLLIPISERQSFDDSRANAVAMATCKVEPVDIEKDLTPARDAMRESVKNARENPDRLLDILPLIPWLPKRALRGVADATAGFSADVPVFCSNVGDLPPDILRIDGTEAEYLFFRGIDRHVTREALERRNGLLTVMAGRVGGRVLMSVVSYQPGQANTKEELRTLVTSTLAEFGLDGKIQ